MSEDRFIHIKGAAVNNLKNIDLDIPRDKFTVITGVSGSGKSSLAFDTIFAEGQRRFAESLSSFARQFLGRMSKPAVDNISGIPPAIAIEQKVNTRNPRSTVGTTTEIYDYLRVLYSKIGHTFSPISGEEVQCDTSESVLKYLKTLPQNEATTLYLLSSIDWNQEKFRIERLLNLKEEGFSRALAVHPQELASAAGGSTSIVSSIVFKIDSLLTNIEACGSDEVMLLVDRISLENPAEPDSDTLTRLLDSIRSAFEKGNGYIACVTGNGDMQTLKRFSNVFEADGLKFDKPEESLFNFNNPLGACPVCGGYGKMVGIDESLVIPNQALSIYQDAIACWRGNVMKAYKEEVIMHADESGIPIHTPYKELTKKQKDTLWEGNGYFIGINGFFKELEAKRYKIQNKYMISRYSGKTTCRACGGSRLRKEALYVRIGGKDIAELMSMSIKDLKVFFDKLTLPDYELQIASRALKEIRQRLDYIDNVGLSYLTLNRHSKTLSGGESQRINLVSSLGNSLTGSMYILDEPSIGLHSRDTARLISVLKKLRDLGNTVIVVEHDEEIIRSADYLIDIGPAAGIYGGEIVYMGPPPTDSTAISSSVEDLPSESSIDEKSHDSQKNSSSIDDLQIDSSFEETSLSSPAHTSATDATFAESCPKQAVSNLSGEDLLKKYPRSLTLQYLLGKKSVSIPPVKRKWSSYIEVCDACENNLKNIDVKFPLRVMTAVIGVSGSGKSTLVGDILYPALSRHLNQFGQIPGSFRELRGDLNKISSVEYVDQNPIGKNSRSNPATYLKVYDDIRKLYSEQPYAKLNGYGHSHFSFNIDGGRCPECQGEGLIHIPMQFMADITMTCEACGGKRFLPDILEVKYKGKDISQVLDMSVDEAIDFFSSQNEPQATRIADKLRPLQAVGLNYIKLGQSSSTLSGGESQRVKLASFLGKDSSDESNASSTRSSSSSYGQNSILFIFDEPTTGLHFDDIQKLLNSFSALLDRGHTIIVVEHNPYIIRAADHIIELGPEGGDQGGQLIRG